MVGLLEHLMINDHTLTGQPVPFSGDGRRLVAPEPMELLGDVPRVPPLLHLKAGTSECGRYRRRTIFLSYGHDGFELLAKMAIVPELRRRGHTVWTDQQIPMGGDWEKEINQGLDLCRAAGQDGVVLLTLSEWAIRRCVRRAAPFGPGRPSAPACV